MYSDEDDYEEDTNENENENTQWESEIMLKDSKWSLVKGKKKATHSNAEL